MRYSRCCSLPNSVVAHVAERAYACNRFVLQSCEKCHKSESAGIIDIWKLKIMPFTVVNMRAHPKPASATYGKCHFLPTMRKRGRSCFKTMHAMTYSYNVGSISEYRGKTRGQQRDVVWEGAFKLFVLWQSEHERDALPRQTTYKSLKDLVVKWYDAWNRGLDCVRSSHQDAHVTYDQLLHLATLLATGHDGDDGSWSHYEIFNDAREACAELKSKMEECKPSATTLHKLLVHIHKLLKHKKADGRSKHWKKTLQKRQYCSAIWRGEVPWLHRTAAPTRSGEPVRLKLEWDWYSHFTFMIDAVSFEDSGSSSSKSKNVYSINEFTFPPALYEQVKHIDSTGRGMFYVVLPAHEGVVCGPDLVFTGSKVHESQQGGNS
jgi:hypothetical protein